MKFHKTLFRVLAMVFIALSNASCVEQNQMGYPETVTLNPNGGNITINGSVTLQNIQVSSADKSGSNVSANPNIIVYEAEWLSIVVDKNATTPHITVYFEPNYSIINRTTKVYGYCGDSYTTIKLIQPPVIGEILPI